MANAHDRCVEAYWLHRFFSNSGAVAGTFTVVGMAVVVAVLMAFLCHRRYRRNKQLPVRVRDLDAFQSQPHKGLFTDDPFARSVPRDSAVLVEGQHNWEKHPTHSTMEKYALEGGFASRWLGDQRAGMWDDTLYEVGRAYLTEANSGFVPNHQGQGPGDPKDQSTSQPPPYDEGPAAVDHTLKITQSGLYLPSTNPRPISQMPSLPSIYPATLSVVEDDDSIHPLFTPTTFVCPGDTSISDANANCGPNARGCGSHRVPVEFEANMALTN
jgi:hypothetical protein